MTIKGFDSLSQVYDVFMERTVSTLKDSTEFVVSINPSGVVMWYLSPASDWQEDSLHFNRDAKDAHAPLVL